MEQADQRTRTIVAQSLLVILCAFLILGFAWYGFSGGAWQRFVNNLQERPHGPMSFRFVLQPIMAAIAAMHDGVADAKLGRTPFVWSVVTRRGERRTRLQEALLSTSRIMLIGLSVDVAYQAFVFHTFFPGEAVAVTILLGFVPYVLMRGPVARLCASHIRKNDAAR